MSFETALTLQGEAATEALANRLSLWARPGLLILLQGDLGTGKSTLARAFIRKLYANDIKPDIPSPTFSLLQTYDDVRVPVFHADLYRLKSADEVDELGLSGLLLSHCGLIEWPDRLSADLTDDVLRISLAGRGASRTAHLQASGQWSKILSRDAILADFVAKTSFASAQRIFFEGDASSRRYEMLRRDDGETALLMDMPQRPDGPPVKHGKPYSAIAHLAEGITAVVAINRHLVAQGYSAPQIWDADLQSGLALIEPLGSNVYGKMMLAGVDMLQPLEQAAAVLADMANRHWPAHPEAAAGVHHFVPSYDRDAQLIEVDLLPSWFIPHARKVAATNEQSESFANVWEHLLPLADPDKPQWVIRDYHSPNLLWLPERTGMKRVGIIDSQDAVMGHAAYDLASMTQDARVDISPELSDHLFDHYCRLRAQDAGFNRSDFATAYAILGAQRATKILGIFARLNKRDGKPVYLQHIPRVSRYLARNLQHPALAALKAWYMTHLPEAIGPQQS